MGKVVSKHSFRGEVLIKLDTDQPEIYENMESVFVAHGNNLVPFFIQSSQLHKSTLLRVKFEDVNDEAGADAIMGSEVYLPLTFLPKLEGNKFYYHEIIGFKVVDQHHGNIGIVQKVVDTSAQAIIEVSLDNKLILIPINDAIIQKLDRVNKTVFVNTPEGLVDLYLS